MEISDEDFVRYSDEEIAALIRRHVSDLNDLALLASRRGLRVEIESQFQGGSSDIPGMENFRPAKAKISRITIL